jgi:hypothetical protein
MFECQNNSSHQAERQLSTQLLLGQCILKLQEYELLLKRLLENVAFSGPPAEVQAVRAEKSMSLRKKMMGELVGVLTKTFLTTAALGDNACVSIAKPENVAWVETRMQIVFAEERYTAIRDALRELVELRNELVHHFIRKFNLSTSEGCAEAEVFLSRSYIKIEENLQLLQTWCKTLAEAQVKLATVFNDPTFQNFIEGISPDGTVDWSRAGIVQGLRDAEGCLAVNGWTSLSAAIERISKNSPDQSPKRYGCSSWRQVLHESRQFDLSRRASFSYPSANKSHPVATVWFRSRRRANAE